VSFERCEVILSLALLDGFSGVPQCKQKFALSGHPVLHDGQWIIY